MPPDKLIRFLKKFYSDAIFFIYIFLVMIFFFLYRMYCICIFFFLKVFQVCIIFNCSFYNYTCIYVIQPLAAKYVKKVSIYLQNALLPCEFQGFLTRVYHITVRVNLIVADNREV